MTTAETKPIWNPATGITDLEVPVDRLRASEIPGIRAVWKDQRKQLEGTQQLHDFTSRLNREWAIETGVIENLYEIERGVTQTFIERGFQAELLDVGTTNKPREFVIKLLRDQQDALEGIFDFVKSNRPLSTSYIKELHAALLRSQDETEGVDAQGHFVSIPLIKGDWKNQPNSPVRDGVLYSYCPPEHVASEMDRLIAIHCKHVDEQTPPEIQAAWLHHRFTQIHPFQDGNGRAARALASLVLVKEELFPLVVTRDDKPVYLDALEAADNGNLKLLIDLIARLQITQFRKASSISESILASDDVDSMLNGLVKAADKVAQEKLIQLRKVFDLAKILESDLQNRMGMLIPSISAALRKVTADAYVSVQKSDAGTEHYFRSEIIQNAKYHLRYFANPTEYRSWVSLSMNWTRRARLIFAFHGIGTPFNGSLICAPFLDFRDLDEDGQTRLTLVPVAEDGFLFFYNDSRDRMLERFKPWREGVIKVAIKELSQNL